MTPICDTLLDDERKADFLSKSKPQSRVEKPNRFSLIARNAVFLLEDIMPTGVYIRTEEHKKQMSISRMGHRDYNPSGKGRFKKEHDVPVAWRKITSQRMKGIQFFKGKKHSLKSRLKMSIAKIGRKLTQEHKNAIRKSVNSYPNLGKWNIGRKHTKEHLRRFSEANSGPKHWHWKGGRRKHSEGYIIAYSSSHPFKNKQGYVFEHRLVMEKHIHRHLLPSEQVHHINGVKDDNRIENLMLFSSIKEHLNYHKKQRREVII